MPALMQCQIMMLKFAQFSVFCQYHWWRAVCLETFIRVVLSIWPVPQPVYFQSQNLSSARWDSLVYVLILLTVLCFGDTTVSILLYPMKSPTYCIVQCFVINCRICKYLFRLTSVLSSAPCSMFLWYYCQYCNWSFVFISSFIPLPSRSLFYLTAIQRSVFTCVVIR